MKFFDKEASRFESLFFLAVLVIFGAYLLDWAIGAAVHSRKPRAVPDLKGHSLTDALSELSPLDLGLREKSMEFDSSVPIGSILRQDPSADSIVREGKIINVVVSEGGQAEIAPSLAGLPLRNAEMLLRENELGLGEVQEAYSLRFDKGLVMGQDPKEESSVEKNSLVNVTLSAGMPPVGVILMPDFNRKNAAQAQIWGEKDGINVAVSSDPTSLFPYGVVLTQTPDPDTVLQSGATVSFVISGRLGSAPLSRGMRMFSYRIPKGGAAESLLRVVVQDKYGEREVFNGLRRAGQRVAVPIEEPAGVTVHVKIFLNGILVEERDL
ncbi:MAG TPA: PASTA domain-containing protein [Elusimicrobiota bacterium]|jgi:eukaryotic-like serine/threonine-protein kinase|nr:PASTA domain-containing protein [Elusimicrobiota bacterium]